MPSIMTAAVTFAAFAIAQKASGGDQFGAVMAFTSLSLISVLIDPVAQLVMMPNNLNSAMSCSDRIQQFLVQEKRDDFRTFREPGRRSEKGGTRSDKSAIEVLVRKEPQTLLTVRDGSFGWEKDKPMLHDISLDFRPSTLTMVIGPVGAGKSTLLLSLLGETYKCAGAVDVYVAGNVAFCSQDPWILNQSIKQNIVGTTDFDPAWYDAVLEACQLQEDVRNLPDGDETVVGSQGSSLSGGQKQRIVSIRDWIQSG